MAEITGFTPDDDFAGWDDEDGTATGMYHYDDGTSMRGQLPAEFAAQFAKPKAPMAADQTPRPEAPAPAAPQAATGSDQSAYDNWEQQQIERERAGKPLSIAIPKESRIAYVHNNPGNLKYVGQEGAHEGEPAEDGGHWAAFETPEAGYQALHHQIQTDADRGLSLGQFITKYAPPKSNDTAGYIASASKALGGTPDQPISGMNRERLARFMAQHESSTTVGGVSPEAQASATAAPQAAQYPAISGSQPSSVGGLGMAEADLNGSPLTRDQLEQRQRSVMDSTHMQMAAQQQAAAARIQGRDEAMAAVTANFQDQQQNQQRQLAEAQAIKAEAANNIHQTMATQLDGGRLFKNMSGGSMLLGLFAVALSAAGQTLQQQAGNTGAQNMGLQMMTKAIDDDVEDQKGNKQSRLAYWSRVYGNAEQGIAATRAEIYNAAAQHLQAQAQTKVQNADIQAGAIQQAGELAALGQKEAAKLQQIEEQKLQIKYAAPKPVTGAQMADQLKSKLEARAQLVKQNASPEVLKAYDQQNGLPDLGPKPAEVPKYNRDQARLLATNEDATAKLKDYARLRGFYYDQKNDKFVGTGSSNRLLPDAMDKQNAEIAQNVDSIAPIIGLIQGGGLKSHVDEIETIQHGLKSSSNNVALAALNQHWQALRNVIKGVRNYPSGAEQESPDEAAPQ
jgi:hypothetical protein